MSDLAQTVRDKIRRTLGQEFVRMEDDFDDTRAKRQLITDKIFSEVANIKLADEEGNLKEDADTGLRMYATALKALADTEKASSQAIMLKLKNQELEVASAAATKDRLEIVLRATAPGAIVQEITSEKLEAQLEAMFADDEIKDFELKSNPRSLDETD